MKKIIALLVTVFLLAGMASIAFADTSFEFWAQSRYASNSDLGWDDANRELKTVDNQRIYVKHWVYGGSSKYTNFFVARDWEQQKHYGGKWATVGMNVPIQSSSIYAPQIYCMAGRGNTNHYENDGVARVSLHGWFYPNL